MNISHAFDTSIPANTCVVQLDDDGQLLWMEQRERQPLRHDSEPRGGLCGRARIALLYVLPIGWSL
ncbi:phospholipase D-like domain-containing protein [Pseudomonas saliphila]|uniref:hypothetical protein n=1 Tax=Pseudomonas saliphila TaxID=2586906 RepID=UPI0015B6DB9F|nr:hypothetical protein [Pseudomonas saliphila]